MISTLDSSIKREIYGKRVAEAAGISEQAMSLEVEKAGKRRRNREKRAQERIDLAPAQQFQRRGGNKVLYHNVKSGVAEQRLIAMLLREPALMEHTGELKTEEFSVPLFSRVYTQLKHRYQAHQDVSLAVLADVSEDEMSHLAGILYEQDLVSEDAFRDCIQTIHHEYQSGLVATEDDLLAFRNKLRERKGIQ